MAENSFSHLFLILYKCIIICIPRSRDFRKMLSKVSEYSFLLRNAEELILDNNTLIGVCCSVNQMVISVPSFLSLQSDSTCSKYLPSNQVLGFKRLEIFITPYLISPVYTLGLNGIFLKQMLYQDKRLVNEKLFATV